MDYIILRASVLVCLQALWGQAVICTGWVVDPIPKHRSTMHSNPRFGWRQVVASLILC